MSSDKENVAKKRCVSRLSLSLISLKNTIAMNLEGVSLAVVDNILDCDIKVSEFNPQSWYYIHFWANTLGKVMNFLMPYSYGRNSSTTFLLQGWLWHWITHKGWYAIRQRNQTKSIFCYFYSEKQKIMISWRIASVGYVIVTRLINECCKMTPN